MILIPRHVTSPGGGLIVKIIKVLWKPKSHLRKGTRAEPEIGISPPQVWIDFAVWHDPLSPINYIFFIDFNAAKLRTHICSFILQAVSEKPTPWIKAKLREQKSVSHFSQLQALLQGKGWREGRKSLSQFAEEEFPFARKTTHLSCIFMHQDVCTC